MHKESAPRRAAAGTAPGAAAWARRAALLGVVVLLPSCSAWQWVKGRFSSSPPPAPTATVAAPASVAPVAPQAPVATPPAPVAEAPVPLIAPPAPVTAEPLPAPTPAQAPTLAAAAPTAPRAAVPPPAGDMRAGRWGVQVGVFLVAANAETIRAKVAGELAADAAFSDAERLVRSVRKGERTHVVVGDTTDRKSAEQLAGKLRAKLRQDVVLFQR
jgi:cell division protein FtsN